ncbi:heavy metal translocating P-type ATPase [Metabacillus halosaccharovorans]|uniref:heavy metal translocating P-type ATPase n=1 Tax=Metabacillus halosaccharovorans TaxID=930124 RepID=UPI00204227B6|nr:heavy metal translocating P-type ATPase [Metabacillus halosaccharovorans]MCM3441728.1 cadmium-translocating P-type ATPase [Metabacillus halosaccharovorans]
MEINNVTQIEQHIESNKNQFYTKWVEHIELINALISGILIGIGWYLNSQGNEKVAIPLFILAFVIGGFAKAKEGIEETIAERTLNVELLMIFAAIGSAIIGYWAEGAILIFIFALSGALETYTMNKSQREISALMSLQPEEALLITNGKERRVHVSTLTIGDTILVKPGERIATDGYILSGKTSIDQSAITGESMPVEKELNDEVYAGTVNGNGSITVSVTKKSTETMFQKILDLVQSAQSEKSPSQQFIEKFEGTYVKAVLMMVALMMVLPHYLLGWSWNETIYRALVLMVVASPCALVASIMPATLSAISNGARKGLLFKGGMHLERLSKTNVVVFDKTGTLTKGEPEVTDILTLEDVDLQEFYEAVLSIENQSNHPLAKAIVAKINQDFPTEVAKMTSVDEKSGFGVKANIHGVQWKIGKADFVGRDAADTFHIGINTTLSKDGKTIVYVQLEDEIIGIIALKDVVRDEAKATIRKLQNNGIKAVMLTGDSVETAEAISKELNIDIFKGECLPEDKVTEIKLLKEKYGNVTMIGDGINDAPALATADVGIAMGEGTDVALETADIVLMKNELSKLTSAFTLSKQMNRIVKQNIVFSMSIIALLICSNFFQVLDLPLGVIGHEGSTILVILNGLRLLRGE